MLFLLIWYVIYILDLFNPDKIGAEINNRIKKKGFIHAYDELIRC